MAERCDRWKTGIACDDCVKARERVVRVIDGEPVEAINAERRMTGPPEEWAEGLWSLDAAVRAAIRGGWTDEEIRDEVDQLVCSHRAEGSRPDA